MGKKLSLCGVFFLVLFLPYYAIHISLPSHDQPVLMYTNHLREDLRRITFKAAKKAKESISIHTYALTDDELLDTLQEKAVEGIDVDITYHKKSTPQLHKLENPHFHLRPIKGKGLMHSKWMIVDERTSYLGTANLTLSSLVMHDNFLLGIHSKKLAKGIKKEEPELHTKVGEQQVDFYLLPQKKALDELIKHLDLAKEKVELALFTFTHPLLVEKLIERSKCGVEVSLFMDAYTAQGASKKAVNQFLDEGIRVSVSQGYPLFHHKWAVIDRKTLILGSANWTKAAFEKNQDFILFLYPLTKEQMRYIGRTLNVIEKDTSTLNPH